jgi:hypothetical protein
VSIKISPSSSLALFKCYKKLAYKLQLPPSSSVHPIFHVSQLKQLVGSGVQVTHPLPSELSSLQVSKLVLQRRIISRGVAIVPQVLIKWSGALVTLAAWEDLEAVRQRFPWAHAWRQAGSSKGGNVRNTKAMVGTTGDDQSI